MLGLVDNFHFEVLFSQTNETYQENDGWVSDECDGGGELALVAARVGARAPVRVRHQAQLLQAPVRHLSQMLSWSQCNEPFGTVEIRCTSEIAYRIPTCPRENLSYIQTYPICNTQCFIISPFGSWTYLSYK